MDYVPSAIRHRLLCLFVNCLAIIGYNITFLTEGTKEKIMFTNKRIGLGITGSFCTLQELLPYAKILATGNTVTSVLSYSVAGFDTRFYKSCDFKRDIAAATGGAIIETIADAEPIGPKKLFDIMIIAPCTGNTLAKLCSGITDTPVLMAAKAHLRNDRPLVIAVSTNDALGLNAKNIGLLLSSRNIYFVPLRQDDPANKLRSAISDLSKLEDACQKALLGEQLQPILL